MPYTGKLLEPELYVVAIGINRYASGSGVANLEFCVPDTRAIVRLFQERTGKLYRQVHVTQLLDDQASRANILKAVRDLAEKARPQDTLVLYAAGHGIALGQRFYLIQCIGVFIHLHAFRMLDSFDLRKPRLKSVDAPHPATAVAACFKSSA